LKDSTITKIVSRGVAIRTKHLGETGIKGNTHEKSKKTNKNVENGDFDELE
jgi:hypothetical protein